MSTGALYRYFKSKEEIIAAIAEQERREVNEFLDHLAAADDFITAFIAGIGEALAISVREDHARIGLEILAEAARNPAIALNFQQLSRDVVRRLSGILRQAIKRGDVDKSLKPEPTAELLIALYEGLEGRAILNPDFNPRKTGPTLTRLCEGLLRPKGQPGKTR